MSNTTDPQVLRKVTRTAVRLIAEDVASKLLVGAAVDEHGISKDDVEAWNDIYDGVLGMIGAALAPLTWPDDQQCAWHELRRFSDPAFLDESDVDQHEITHPEQCSTLPPGAACWAEHQPFRWWWPTEHGTYRIRPEDVLTGGNEDGPDYQTTLRVQVLRDGEWFEYTNDIIGADPTDETPKILKRLKAGLAEKAAADAAAKAEQDGDAQAVAEAVLRLKRWLVGRQANVHSEVSSTNVIAEPRDRSTAAWAIAESDVAAVVAVLEARGAKAGGQ